LPVLFLARYSLLASAYALSSFESACLITPSTSDALSISYCCANLKTLSSTGLKVQLSALSSLQF